MATGRHLPGSLPIQNTEVPDLADRMPRLNVTEGGGEINVLDLSGRQTEEAVFKEYFSDEKWQGIKNKDPDKIKKKAEKKKTKYDDLLRNFTQDELRDFPDSFHELPDHIRIMLIGKTGTGKSSAANTIFGQDNWFKTSVSAESVTKVNQVQSLPYKDKNIQVLDTPGLIDTNRGPEEVAKEIAKVVEVFPDGIHAFVYIINISSHRFTDEDQEAVEQVKEIFGADIMERTFLMFTHAKSVLKAMTLPEYIAEQKDGSPLKKLIDEMRGRVMAFENDVDVRYLQTKQRDMFFTMLNFLMKQYGYAMYTNSMFRVAEKLRVERQSYLKQLKLGFSWMKDQVADSLSRWNRDQQECFRTELNQALTDKLESALEKAGLCNSAGEKFEEQKRIFGKKRLTRSYREALEPLVKGLSENAQQYFSENPHIIDTITIEHINKKYEDFEKISKHIEKEIKGKRSFWRRWCSIM